MAMQNDELARLIREAFPDAEVTITDMAGDGDHYSAKIVSTAFEGIPRIRQHQMGIEGQFGGSPNGLYNWDAEAQVGYEMSVHDVQVQQVGARFFNARDVGGEVREICRQDRRSHGNAEIRGHRGSLLAFG